MAACGLSGPPLGVCAILELLYFAETSDILSRCVLTFALIAFSLAGPGPAADAGFICESSRRSSRQRFCRLNSEL